jgi:hypothetical protein
MSIQFGERTLVIPLVSIPDSPLCPVQAYLNMQSLVCASDDSPAYCFVKHKQIYPIIYRHFQSVSNVKFFSTKLFFRIKRSNCFRN